MSQDMQQEMQKEEIQEIQEIPQAQEEVQKDEKQSEKKEEKPEGRSSKKDDPRRVGWVIVEQKRKKDENVHISYTVNRLLEAFREAKFELKVINASDIDVYLTNFERKSVQVRNVIHKNPDFVLSRTGAKTDFYTLAVYRHLEKMDVPIMNGPEAVETVKNKLYTLQILAQNGIPVPKTILLKFPVNLTYVIKRLGIPVIIKLLSGMQGKGVFIARTEDELQTHIDMLESVKPEAQMIFQECMTHSLGTDVRVLVVGGKVIGAMKRTNHGKDFRANIHRGGVGSLYHLPANAEYIALSAVRLLGLDIAGVDLLFDNESHTRFRVCEVNSSPGFEGFEKAVKTDVAKAIVSFVRIKCGFPPDDSELGLSPLMQPLKPADQAEKPEDKQEAK
jgi:gamma-F420-2:alpha-L-glutamate ligase